MVSGSTEPYLGRKLPTEVIKKKETCKTKGKIKQTKKRKEKLGSNGPANAIQKIADVFKNSVRITSD